MAGYSEREIQTYKLLIKIILATTAVLFILATLVTNIWWIKFILGGVLACIIWLQISQKKIQLHLLGIKGENNVLDYLNRLPRNYKIIHGVEIKKIGDIDFIVVGPKGVATVEVKSHRGRFFYHDGKLNRKFMPVKKDFIKQAKREAWAVHELILDKLDKYVYVQPIIVFSNPGASIHEGPKPLPGTNVIAVRFDWINNTVLGLCNPISDVDIAQIVMLLQQAE